MPLRWTFLNPGPGIEVFVQLRFEFLDRRVGTADSLGTLLFQFGNTRSDLLLVRREVVLGIAQGLLPVGFQLCLALRPFRFGACRFAANC